MLNFKKLFVLFVVACTITQVSGLRCWRCENAKSTEDCLTNGYAKTCRFSEKSCQTEVRLSERTKLRIKTDCKELRACQNNKIQNRRRAWDPTQCNNNILNSVCRCCCRTNNCNRKNLLCGTNKVAREDFSKPGNIRIPKEPSCGKLPVTPKKGKKVCYGNGEVGTKCTFSCDQGYKLNGSSLTMCSERGRQPAWTEEAPECIQEFCTDPGNLRQGVIHCDEVDYRVGTACNFSCIVEGYKLMPNDRTQIKCIRDGTEAKWNYRKPCCSTPCTPMAKKDVIIIMDSSNSISKKEWSRMKQFVANVTGNFDVSDDGVRFAIYRFTRKVDEEHEVHFRDFINNGESLKQAVMDLPKSGGGTYIGRALQHAKDKVLKDGNREDVKDLIWVLTDGRSDDDTQKISQELRDAGVEIIALGITHKGKELSKEDLLDIAGYEENVLHVMDGMKSLTDHLVSRIVGKLCESSCQG